MALSKAGAIIRNERKRMNRTLNPKILIVTTPIRPVPTYFPPLGSLSVVTALRKAGFEETQFFNIDLLRPKYSEIIETIKRERPDILGISAVVSTAYEFTKRLSLDIKRELPGVTILLGGNLGASAEIVLRKTGVDFVCTGEGETTVVEFVRTWIGAGSRKDYSTVKGLAFLNEAGQMLLTPYADPISNEALYDIDWSILEDLGQMEFFIHPKEGSDMAESSFSHDPRTFEAPRDGKSVFVMIASKGCVARCTFCHRWDKGFRVKPVPVLMREIDHFIEKYNLGFIGFSDENFGSDKKWLREFLQEIKKRDLIWRVSGMRVSTLSEPMIQEMNDAGCSMILCGMESGSQTILDIMEKVTTVEQNKNTVKWLAQNEMTTTVQLVIGMPGENPKTIRETCEFTSYFAEQSPHIDPNNLSINFAQALPGTPLYEFARRKRLIGGSVNDEEEYLLKISDRDARDGETQINFTDYPKLLLEKWRFEIQIATQRAFLKKWGIRPYFQNILRAPRLKNIVKQEIKSSDGDTGYFADPARIKEHLILDLKKKFGNAPVSADFTDTLHEQESRIQVVDQQLPSLKSLIRQRAKIGHIAMFYPRFFWRTRHFLILLIIANTFRKYPFKLAWSMTLEYLQWKILNFSSQVAALERGHHLSLRKILRKNILPDIGEGDPAMTALRRGR